MAKLSERKMRTLYLAGEGGISMTDSIVKFNASAMSTKATIGVQINSTSQTFVIGAVGIISSSNTADAEAQS
jgi:hypothetical protein